MKLHISGSEPATTCTWEEFAEANSPEFSPELLAEQKQKLLAGEALEFGGGAAAYFRVELAR